MEADFRYTNFLWPQQGWPAGEEKKKEKDSQRQQNRSFTGTLSASWSSHVQDTRPQKQYYCGWRLAAVGGGRLAVGGG